MTTLTEQRSPRAVPTSAAAVTRKPFPLVRHSLSLAKRSLIKTWRTPEALIDVTLQPAIFLVIFVYIFGGAVAGDTHTYLQFLLPGILAQTIAQGAIAIGVNLNTDLDKGIFDRFKSLPIPRSSPLIGAVLGDVVRYVIVILSTFVVGYLMGFRILTDPLSAVAGCLLAVAVRPLPELGLRVRRDEGPDLRRGAGDHVPHHHAAELRVERVRPGATTLPSWMQNFVAWNPLTHLVAAMRGLFLGTPMGDSVYWTLAWCVGLVAVFLPLALRAYRRKV